MKSSKTQRKVQIGTNWLSHAWDWISFKKLRRSCSTRNNRKSLIVKTWIPSIVKCLMGQQVYFYWVKSVKNRLKRKKLKITIQKLWWWTLLSGVLLRSYANFKWLLILVSSSMRITRSWLRWIKWSKSTWVQIKAKSSKVPVTSRAYMLLNLPSI